MVQCPPSLTPRHEMTIEDAFRALTRAGADEVSIKRENVGQVWGIGVQMKGRCKAICFATLGHEELTKAVAELTEWIDDIPGVRFNRVL